MRCNRFRFSIFLTVLILSSCIRGKNNNPELANEVTLAPSGQILKMPIDTNTTLDCFAMFYYKDRDTDKEYLTYLNSYKNEIQFYDLKLQKLDYKVTCALEGPDGVGKVLGFRVINKDSIYLTNMLSIYLINSDGRIIKKYDNYKSTFSKNNNEINTIIPTLYRSTSRVYLPLVKKGEKLYLTQSLVFNKAYLPKTKMSPSLNSKVCLVINENGQKEYLPMEHPLTNEEDLTASASAYSREFDENNFVYSFFDDPKVYVTQDHVHVENFSASSKYIDKIVHLKYKSIPSFEKSNIDYIKSASYFNIIYDRYREVYYRFVKIPDNYEKGDDMMRLIKYPQNFSIIVLSKEFQVIGETKFPPATYEYKNFFVAEAGLYLSINHIDNPTLDINNLQFELIKVQHNEK